MTELVHHKTELDAESSELKCSLTLAHGGCHAATDAAAAAVTGEADHLAVLDDGWYDWLNGSAAELCIAR